MIKGFQGSELVADISVPRPKGCVSLDMKAREKPGLGLGLLRFFGSNHHESVFNMLCIGCITPHEPLGGHFRK